MSSTPTTPNPFAMPMGDLAAAAGIPAPEAPAAAPAAPAVEPVAAPVAAPAAPIVPEPFSVQQDDAGITIQMSPDFGGEVFKGKDWAEVGPKIAKAKADANAYIKQLKTQPVATPEPSKPAAPPVDPAVQATRDWMLSETAAALGMTVDEYKARVQMVFSTSEQMATNIAVADFHKMCPGYVDTPDNSAAMQSYFPADFDHFPSAQELKQAYALAVIDGKIKPATPQAAAPAVPRPVPMPASGGQPTSGEANPWTMPLEELGKMAGVIG